MDALLLHLADSIPEARTLEELTRPLLDMLQTATEMESTYLTLIDLERGEQTVLFARNGQDMTIPEGLTVPWEVTLCKRALEENMPYTQEVPERWGDSEAARQLGIQTYLSTAVRDEQGSLLGTLCGVSSQRVALPANVDRLLRLFARLIAQQIERERLVQSLQQANRQLAAAASTDPLTGLANRRLLMIELERLLAQGQRLGHTVLVGMVDLDGFKQINDRLGHAAGDQLLQTIGRALANQLRGGDLLARIGGDEFAVTGPGPALGSAELEVAARVMADRLHQCTVGRFAFDGVEVHYEGASVGVVAVDPSQQDADAALIAADKAMYRMKQARTSS